MIIGIVLAAAIANVAPKHVLCDANGFGPPVWCDTRKPLSASDGAKCIRRIDGGDVPGPCGWEESIGPSISTTGLGATTSMQSVISAGFECGRHVINGAYYWQGRRVSAARWYEHIGRWYAGGLREDCRGLQ